MPDNNSGERGQRQKKEFSLTKFGGINVTDARNAIADNEFSWIENLIPIGDGNLVVPISNSTTKFQISSDPTEIVKFAYSASLIMPLSGSQQFPTIKRFMIVTTSLKKLYAVDLDTNLVSFKLTNVEYGAMSAATWNSSHILITDSFRGLFAMSASGGIIGLGGIGNIVMTAPGTGYTSAPSVVATGGGGSGFAATAYINSAGNITGVVVTAGGTGYTSAPTISFSGGGGSGATATAYVLLGPQQGTSVATYAGRAWVANNRSVFYSDTNTFTNFAGGSSGSFTIYDQTLENSITALYVTNNYLYIFGDASIDIVGDVSVAGSGTLLFTRTNITSSVGTSFPQSIFSIGSTIYFASPNGFYTLNGVSTNKISRKIDPLFFGKFDSSTNGISGAQISMAGTNYPVFNLGIVDNYSGLYPIGTNRYVSLIYFDNKWIVTATAQNPSFATTSNLICPLLIGGVPSAYSFAYSSFGPVASVMFSEGNDELMCKVITKFYNGGNIISNKQVLKCGIVGSLFSGSSHPLTINVDSENGTTVSLSSGTINNGLDFLFSNVSSLLGKYFGVTLTLNLKSKSATSPTPTTINEIVVEYEEGARW